MFAQFHNSDENYIWWWIWHNNHCIFVSFPGKKKRIVLWQHQLIQWNFIITRTLGPWKLHCLSGFLLYQGKKLRNVKSWDQQDYLVMGFFFLSDPFITRFHCISELTFIFFYLIPNPCSSNEKQCVHFVGYANVDTHCILNSNAFFIFLLCSSNLAHIFFSLCSLHWNLNFQNHCNHHPFIFNLLHKRHNYFMECSFNYYSGTSL